MDASNVDDYEIAWTPSATTEQTTNYDDQGLAKQVYDLLSEDQLTLQSNFLKPTSQPANQDATLSQLNAFPGPVPSYLAPRKTIGLDPYALRSGSNEFVQPASASVPVANEIPRAALMADYGSRPLPSEYPAYSSPHPLWFPRRVPVVRRRRFGGYHLHRPYAPLYPHRWNRPWFWHMRRRRRPYLHEKPPLYPTLATPQLFEDAEEPLLLGPKTETTVSGEGDEDTGRMVDFSLYED
ncbi:hypothetical protein SprV_0301332800 [Sparganum proliferum]